MILTFLLKQSAVNEDGVIDLEEQKLKNAIQLKELQAARNYDSEEFDSDKIFDRNLDIAINMQSSVQQQAQQPIKSVEKDSLSIIREVSEKYEEYQRLERKLFAKELHIAVAQSQNIEQQKEDEELVKFIANQETEGSKNKNNFYLRR